MSTDGKLKFSREVFKPQDTLFVPKGLNGKNPHLTLGEKVLLEGTTNFPNTSHSQCAYACNCTLPTNCDIFCLSPKFYKLSLR